MSASEPLYYHHLLAVWAPDFQAKATDDVHGVEAGGLGLAEFRDGPVNLRQAIERYIMVQVMDVMIADVAGEPAQDGTHFQMARGIQRGALIGPTGLVL